jgi:hypothetical protein
MVSVSIDCLMPSPMMIDAETPDRPKVRFITEHFGRCVVMFLYLMKRRGATQVFTTKLATFFAPDAATRFASTVFDHRAEPYVVLDGDSLTVFVEASQTLPFHGVNVCCRKAVNESTDPNVPVA